MHEVIREVKTLKLAIDKAMSQLHLDRLRKELSSINIAIEANDFWQDNQRAQDTMKQKSKLEGRIEPWTNLDQAAQELVELATMNDTSLETEIKKQLEVLQQNFASLKQELKYSGPFDDHDAILSIYAGAGGTDAQDWAQMLLRMYVRWAEKNDMLVTTDEETAGEEAGIKSATIEITGSFAFGKLKGEHGVHRLVRLSPFNSDNLRQTSFAKVEILPKVDKPDALEIDDKDLKIDVYRSGGRGGQSVNTTDSAVRITHLPTGIVISIQNERSQLQNKETAMTILRSKLAQLQLEQHSKKISELKGPNQSAEWGNQIRSYVLHPYKQVKDLRTRYESSDPERVLDGDIDTFIEAYLENTLGQD